MTDSATNLHVLHVITDGGVGGAQSYVRDVAIEQTARGHTVHVAAGSSGSLGGALTAAGIECTVLPSLVRAPGPRDDVRAYGELRALIARLRPAVVHCHSSKAGILGRLASRREHVPSVYTAHGWPFRHGGFVAQRAVSFAGECIAARVGTHVICVSKEEAQLATRWRVVPRRKLSTVHVGVPDAEHMPHVPTSTPHIVSIMRLAPPKLPVLLVQTLALLRDVDWTCEIAGDGPMLDDVRRAVAEHELDERVHLVGTVGEPQSFLARADVFVLLSHSEGMPVSVLEAMRAGVPVVCSDLPGTRLELDDGRVGVLTGNDAPSAAKALRGLLDAPAVQRAELADAARARFEELFRIGPAVDAIEAVYERALDHHRRKPASGDR